MPLYEYRCRTCGATEELRCSIPNRDNDQTCYECPKVYDADLTLYSVMSRVLTAPHLHGSANMPNG